MKKFAFVSALALVSLAVPARATLEVISYSVGLLSKPPASVLKGNLTSNNFVFLFLEQQSVTLASALKVDVTAPGTYTATSQLPGGLTVPAGSKVNSYFLHANPASGSVTFANESVAFSTDESVVGIQLTSPTIAAGSKTLGISTTQYNGAAAQNGLHLSPNGTDSITLSSDLHTVTFSETLGAKTLTEFRLITVTSGSPGQARTK